MLNDEQRKLVRDKWLGAEIRAGYFAQLSTTARTRQRRYTILSLILTSGAFVSLVTTIASPKLVWIRPLLSFLAAVLSAVILGSRNESMGTEFADLHFRWNVLATEYGRLWAEVDSESCSAGIRAKLKELQDREAEVSKGSLNLAPNRRLLRQVQDNVHMLHGGVSA